MNFVSLGLRNLLLRKWRTALLLAGYGLGVATMIVLLSIGEALVLQASDERLIGGGDVTVLPEGIDVEVMKTGGLGGMFFSIDHSRFIHRQLLAAPRFGAMVTASAPQITGKLLYVFAGTRVIPVLASGEIPSLTARVGAAPRLVAGEWRDTEADRRWASPTPRELRDEIDRFHLPPAEARGDSTWAEWHYFNVLWPGRQKWAFISFIVGGAVPGGRWGGQVLVTVHEVGRPARRFVSNQLPAAVSFSTTGADVGIGPSSVVVLPNGDYHVAVRAAEEGTGTPLQMDLDVRPTPNAFFPGAALGGTAVVSGYVVPALRADASGRVCVSARCEDVRGVQSYHDHNWGVWRDVAWEWGEARAGDYTLLYGRLLASGVADQPLFLYIVDSLGFVGLYRPKGIEYTDGRTVIVDGRAVRVPSRAVMQDVRGSDVVTIELDIDDAAATDVRKSSAGRPGTPGGRYFVQLKGSARISGSIGGRALSGSGQGFFETYR
jgi:hypothetical protein